MSAALLLNGLRLFCVAASSRVEERWVQNRRVGGRRAMVELQRPATRPHARMLSVFSCMNSGGSGTRRHSECGSGAARSTATVCSGNGV